MKTHAKHATLMVYNQQDIKDCGIEAKIMWRTFSTRYADVPKYSGVWVRLSEKGGYLFGIGKKSNIFAEGAAFGSYKVNPGKDDEFTEDSFMLKEFDLELKRWYHLKMAAKGSHFTFYLDGEKVGETENDLFEKGQLAVYTVSSAEASFDDVIITYLVDDK